MTKLELSKLAAKGPTSGEKERLLELMMRGAKLINVASDLYVKGYDGIYPTRRDLMIECGKIREAIQKLEENNDIIARSVSERGRGK